MLSAKRFNFKYWFSLAVVLFIAIAGFFAVFAMSLQPVNGVDPQEVEFLVERGDGFQKIAAGLKEKNLIRFSTAFKIFSLLTGSADDLKPGNYLFNRKMSAPEINKLLAAGSRREIAVLIPEGVTLRMIDEILAEQKILPPRALIAYDREKSLEGRLFPDTYRFFTDSSPQTIVDKFLDNFKNKAESLLNRDPANFKTNLILASMVEREVIDFKERRLVAGILKKRLRSSFPLQVDATICYIKQDIQKQPQACHPLVALDLKIDSPYNTYLYKGLPPGPIGNPGEAAIRAVIESLESPYWYYLTDPITKRTIFAKSFEEHRQNRFKYLKE